MNALQIYIISMVAAIVSLFSCVVQAQSVVILTDNGQIVECTEFVQNNLETDKPASTIAEEDYPYLKNIACLQNGSFFDKWHHNLEFRNVNRDNNTHYVLSGHGPNIKVNARYNSEGNLVDATLIKKDTQVPQAILRFIYSNNEFNGWTMVSNEMIVKDFDSYQTEYRVNLSNGQEERVLHFKDQGENIAYLNHR